MFVYASYSFYLGFPESDSNGIKIVDPFFSKLIYTLIRSPLCVRDFVSLNRVARGWLKSLNPKTFPSSYTNSRMRLYCIQPTHRRIARTRLSSSKHKFYFIQKSIRENPIYFSVSAHTARSAAYFWVRNFMCVFGLIERGEDGLKRKVEGLRFK